MNRPIIRIARDSRSCGCCDNANYEGRPSSKTKKVDAIYEIVVGNMVSAVCPDCLRSLVGTAVGMLINADPATDAAAMIRVYSGEFQSEDNAANTSIWDDPVTPQYTRGEAAKKLMEELEFIPAADGRECSDCEHYQEDSCGGSITTSPCTKGFDFESVSSKNSVPGSHYNENASFYWDCADVEIPKSIVDRIRATNGKDGK